MDPFVKHSLSHKKWLVRIRSEDFVRPIYIMWLTDTSDNDDDKVLTNSNGQIVAASAPGARHAAYTSVGRNAMRQTILLFGLIICLDCCHRPCRFYDDIDHVINEPTKEELAGNYMPDDKSIRAIRNRGFDKEDFGQVVIKESGEFILTEVPKPFLDKYGDETISSSGTWRLSFDERDNTSHITINYDSVGQLKGLVYGMRIYKRNDKLILFRFLGDPDECQCLMYERQ